MITKFYVENAKIGYRQIKKLDLNLKHGLNIISWADNYRLFNLISGIILDALFFQRIKPLDNNEGLSSLVICVDDCELGEDLKYTLTYLDGNILTETLILGKSLIGHVDYDEGELQKGTIYWDTLGSYEMLDPWYTETTAGLLQHTLGGRKIKEALGKYEYVSGEYTDFKISNLFLGGKNMIGEINELLPRFGFDVEIEGDGEHRVGFCSIPGQSSGIPINEQGSGFIHLLNILTKLLYCKENNRTLIIQGYDMHLHPLLKRTLEDYLSGCGVNIIASEKY